jgi:hypothetical protein
MRCYRIILATHFVISFAFTITSNAQSVWSNSSWNNPWNASNAEVRMNSPIRVAANPPLAFDPYATSNYPLPPLPDPMLGNPDPLPAVPPLAPNPTNAYPQPTPFPQFSNPFAGLIPLEPVIWRFEPYGEFIYLRPRNSQVTYAVPIRGPFGPGLEPVLSGAPAVVESEYEPGFRVGLDIIFNEKSRLGAKYAYFRSNAIDTISVEVPNAVRPLVTLPSTMAAATDVLDANASYGIDFDTIDFDFKAMLYVGEQTYIEALIGARYASLQQDFRAVYTAIGNTTVDANINFDGAGIRFGLEGERRATRSGWLVYGRGEASFVGGEFQAAYAQTDATGVLVGGGPVGGGSWETARIVPILELEFGVGWINRTGRLRFSGGYMISGWFNSVITDDFIEAVQQNRFVNLSDTLTFDGFVARAEVRF